MPTFVLMTKLQSELMGETGDRRAAGRAWLKKVKAVCPEVKWISHYAILGRYDFMDIYEAPDSEAAHRVSMLSRSQGAIEAESWQALPYERFLELFDEVVQQGS